MTRTVAVVLALAFAAYNITLGLWAFAAPESFYASIASFPPYNRHLLHDVGAFLTGLGVALLAGVWQRRLLAAAAAGNAAAAVLHAAAHVEDARLGGHSYDVPALLLIAALSLLLLATALTSARRAA